MTGTQVATDARTAPALPSVTDPPYASHWHPDTLLTWDPATDPNALFNRSRVPLMPREQNAGLRANSNARAGEARIAACCVFADTSKNPSQGFYDHTFYAFSHWQYLDTLVFWGGSAGEGLILAPSAPVIDAAHRNGVKVYGTVFFPQEGKPGGKKKWLEQFVQRTGAAYPVADKLIHVAQHYGFEGWFINQETGGDEGADATIARGFRDVLAYARATSTVEFMWYDSMVASGKINWQSELNDANKMFLQDGGVRVSDSLFLDYRWSQSKLTTSGEKATGELKRSRYDVYAGVEMSWAAPLDPETACPQGKQHLTSVALFVPEDKSMPKKVNGKYKTMDLADFYKKEAKTWVGANGNPASTPTEGWRGIARYVAESTPVRRLPFVTHFNTGHGTGYFRRGEKVRTGGWNNLSLQDVLPTYRWVVEPADAGVLASFSFTDAYEGGTSLRLSGKLTANKAATVRLYQTRLPLTSASKATVALRTPAAGATHLKLALAFSDTPTEFTTIDLGSTTSANWETRTLSLAGYANRTVVQLALRAVSTTTVDTYAINVGQIAVHDGAFGTPGAPANVRNLGTVALPNNRKGLRLAWTPSAPEPAVHHYEVYRRRAQNASPLYLGGTPNTVYYVDQLEKQGETTITLDVVAVSPDGTRSASTPFRFTWS
ncbi:endo-beta-N-acetylglucosaminidase [Streptomyces buecherae]|uniref:endo-beta-N-acetylglucosaminidase n=1 Tax=Streptomyces buecherae TaxID=2763006 RepID=UPI0037883750